MKGNFTLLDATSPRAREIWRSSSVTTTSGYGSLIYMPLSCSLTRYVLPWAGIQNSLTQAQLIILNSLRKAPWGFVRQRRSCLLLVITLLHLRSLPTFLAFFLWSTLTLFSRYILTSSSKYQVHNVCIAFGKHNCSAFVRLSLSNWHCRWVMKRWYIRNVPSRCNYAGPMKICGSRVVRRRRWRSPFLKVSKVT